MSKIVPPMFTGRMLDLAFQNILERTEDGDPYSELAAYINRTISNAVAQANDDVVVFKNGDRVVWDTDPSTVLTVESSNSKEFTLTAPGKLPVTLPHSFVQLTGGISLFSAVEMEQVDDDQQVALSSAIQGLIDAARIASNAFKRDIENGMRVRADFVAELSRATQVALAVKEKHLGVQNEKFDAFLFSTDDSSQIIYDPILTGVDAEFSEISKAQMVELLFNNLNNQDRKRFPKEVIHSWSIDKISYAFENIAKFYGDRVALVPSSLSYKVQEIGKELSIQTSYCSIYNRAYNTMLRQFGVRTFQFPSYENEYDFTEE